MTTVDQDRYRIGEVARRVGVTTRTIRYYEELGLLGAGSSRPKGAHRLYDEEQVARLEEIVRLRDLLGLSLEELVELTDAERIRAALRDQWHGNPDDAGRRAIVDEAMRQVERQLALVRARQERLAAVAAELEAKLEAIRARQRSIDPS